MTADTGLEKRIDTLITRMKEAHSKQGHLGWISEADYDLIIRELSKMKVKKGVRLTYPRAIVDRWDYNNPLGEELLEISELYRRQ